MDKLTKAVERLSAVLLDPEGNASIRGSDENNRIITIALRVLASVVIQERQSVWVAWTNSDLTEGRGHCVPMYVCENKATADRLGKGKYVQGTDCPVTEEVAVWIERGYCDGGWLSRVNIIKPTGDDKTQDAKRANMEAAEAKALELGLTPKEIMSIKGA